MIAEGDRTRLLTLARAALVAQVARGSRPSVPEDLAVDASGVFVTVYCRGDLRGCLGSLDLRESLPESVARLAADVAYRDYRFDPIRPEELDDVALDLSVLTPPEIVRDLATIVIGRDGLIVEQGHSPRTAASAGRRRTRLGP